MHAYVYWKLIRECRQEENGVRIIELQKDAFMPLKSHLTRTCEKRCYC